MLNLYSIYCFISLMINVNLLYVTSRKEEADTTFIVQNKTHQPEQQVLLPVQNQEWKDLEQNVSFAIQNKTQKGFDQELVSKAQNKTKSSRRSNDADFLDVSDSKVTTISNSSLDYRKYGSKDALPGGFIPYMVPEDEGIPPVQDSGGFVPQFDAGGFASQQYNAEGFAPQLNAGGFGPQNYAGGLPPPQYNARGFGPQNYAGGFAPQQYNAEGFAPQFNAGGFGLQNYAGGYTRPQLNAGGFAPQYNAGRFVTRQFLRGVTLQQYNSEGFTPSPSESGSSTEPKSSLGSSTPRISNSGSSTSRKSNSGSSTAQKSNSGSSTPQKSNSGSSTPQKSNSGSSTPPSPNSESFTPPPSLNSEGFTTNVPEKMLRQGINVPYTTTHLSWHGYRMLNMMKRVNLRRPYEIYPERVGQRVLEGLPALESMKDCHCPHVYHAVCGTDGVTYLNECVLNCMAMNKRYKKLQDHLRKEDRKILTKRRDGPCILF